MKRREFITLLGGAAAAWPLAARAQQPARLPTIGYLGRQHAFGREPCASPPLSSDCANSVGSRAAPSPSTIAGRRGATSVWPRSRPSSSGSKVDVIVTAGTPQTLAAKHATSVIPIVFAAVGDPVGAGVVEFLARPGGNATGLSMQQTDTAGKRLELLRDVIPSLRRLAIMANAGNAPGVLEMSRVQAAARALGFEAVTSEIRRRADIAAAFDALKGRVEALYICNDPLVGTSRVHFITLALGMRLPTMFNTREYVEAGGLMSFGSNFPGLYRRAAERQQDPARTPSGRNPVEQPTKFELVINLITAKELGLNTESLLPAPTR